MRSLSISWCLLLWVLAKQVLSSTPGGATTPIRHWDASWTASCAQGTAIALTFDDCVLLFLRSPSSNVYKPPATAASSSSVVELSGLSVTPVDPGRQHVYFAPSWICFSNSLCAMTGLASDVEHLARILQRQVDNHYNVYTKPLTTHATTQRVANVLQQAAQAKGGRPFGVQTLMVGGDDVDPTRKMCVYSMDPSGSWQSWGGATAIGKYAKQVRDALAKKRATPPSSLHQALEQMVECWMETCQQENVNLQAEEDYQVLILRRESDNGEACKLYMVGDDEVRGIVEKASAGLVK